MTHLLARVASLSLLRFEIHRECRRILDRAHVQMERITADTPDDARLPEHRCYLIRRDGWMGDGHGDRWQPLGGKRTRTDLRNRLGDFKLEFAGKPLGDYLARALRNRTQLARRSAHQAQRGNFVDYIAGAEVNPEGRFKRGKRKLVASERPL